MGGLHIYIYIYIDFKKAFDKVPHRGLLCQQKHIRGLKGTIKNWMEDYLKGKEIRTVVKDEISEC